MATATLPEELTLTIDMQMTINAPASRVFAAILKQLGPDFGPDGSGKMMPLVLEAHPGGRWYRDLGNNQGHLWGHVQVIKKDRLLEMTGPMFMSFAAINHIQYKLDAEGDKTKVSFIHTGIGKVADEHRAGMTKGWTQILESIRKIAESK